MKKRREKNYNKKGRHTQKNGNIKRREKKRLQRVMEFMSIRKSGKERKLESYRILKKVETE